MSKKQIEWREGFYEIFEENLEKPGITVLLGEFHPEFRYPKAIYSGTLITTAISFPKHFSNLFNEGDGLNRLEEVLKNYLDKVEAWKKFCAENPEVKVYSDGLSSFKAEWHIKFKEPVKSREELLEKLEFYLETLISINNQLSHH